MDFLPLYINVESQAASNEPDDSESVSLPVNLVDGLIGCEMWKHFVLEVIPDIAPLMLLHSLDQDNLSFIVTDPRTILPDYRLQLSDAERSTLGNPDPQQIITLVILNAATRETVTRVTANLLGPIVINTVTGAARQVIQPDFSAHQPVGETIPC